MAESFNDHEERGRRRQRALLAGMALALALLVASCPVGMLLVKQRVVRPPSFAFQIGETEIAAPCPTREFICDDTFLWWAIWRSDPEPDGTTTVRQLFFMYLEPPKRR